MGGKGPAVMLIRGQAQYRNAYIIALANKNWIAAVDAVLGMASIMPKETNQEIPEPPKQVFKQTLEQADIVKIQEWLLVEKVKVERAVSQYVYKFYKTGASNSL